MTTNNRKGGAQVIKPRRSVALRLARIHQVSGS